MRHLAIAIGGDVVKDKLGQFIHGDGHIAVLKAETRKPRASAALLVLGEAVGCSLGVTAVIEDVVSAQSIGLAVQAAKVLDGPLATSALIGHPCCRGAAVFHIISVGGKSGTGKREIQLFRDLLPIDQVSDAQGIAHTHCHERELQTHVGRQLASQVNLDVINRWLAAVSVIPVIGLEHQFPVLARTHHVGGVIGVEGLVAPLIGTPAESDELGVLNCSTSKIHMAMLQRTPPVTAVVDGVVGLIHLLMDAFHSPLL